MPKQRIPDIDWDDWVIAELPELFSNKDIYINEEYQRGDIWTHTQKIELIKSINNSYSIGVIVLFINERNQHEILDGQQRLLTIKQYLNGELDLSGTELIKYSGLSTKERTHFDDYSIYGVSAKSSWRGFDWVTLILSRSI